MLKMTSARDRGATSAEYVGVLVFVAVLAVAVIAFSTPLGSSVTNVASRALCKISSLVGGGCAADATPYYKPKKCVISNHEGAAGGSVTVVVVKLGGDGSYNMSRVRSMQPDGSFEDTYLVTTKLQGSVEGRFTLGAGAEAQTGEGGVSAKADLEATVGIQGAHGKSYEFGSLDAAEDFVGDWKSTLDVWPGDSFDPPDAKTEFYEGGVNASGSGQFGGTEASADGATVVGYTKDNETGDSIVSFTTDLQGSATLGIPLPREVIELQASGNLGGQVGVNATFDKDGNLVGVDVSVLGHLEGGAGAGIDKDRVLPADRNGDGAVNSADDAVQGISDFQLPSIPSGVEGGAQMEMKFSTTFRGPDGELNYEAAGAAGNAIKRFVSGGGTPTADEKAALQEQLAERSRITTNFYSYDSEEDQYGLEGKLGPVVLGGEVHVSSVDRGILGGYYWNPDLNTWDENVACKS